MNAVHQLLIDQLGIWTAAEAEKKSGRGRSSGNGVSVYGVKKLRELILELAVRGKLVPQDPNDEPASELLKRIQAEKAKLIAGGKIKKGKPLLPITDDEKPFELPGGWEWARLDNFVLSILSGGTPSKNNSEFWNGDIPWASVKDLNVEKFLDSTQDYITKDGLEAGSKLANKGDLLICTRMGLGKIAIAAMDVAINQDLKALKITSQLDIDYFINFYSTLKIIGSGMTVAGIRQDELLGYCLPTPPLAEQHRIVAKVDELMALCDQLETQHINAAEAHEKLVNHLLATLTQAQSADDFSANWQRIAAHFDTLFTTESSIDALKQTLLQLAVMGKLVPQDPNDEPASELLKRIQAEKDRLIAEGKIKKGKPLPPITEEEKPFELPLGWEWVRLDKLMPEFQNGASSRGDPDGESVVVLRLADIKDRCISLENPRELLISPNIIKKYRLFLGDILIVRVNGSADLVGGFVVCEQSVNGIYCDHFIRMRISQNICNPRFLTLIGASQLVRDRIKDLFITTAGQKTVNQGHISSLIIPFLSVTEQHRIVTKVDELMALCDQLKTRITEASQLQQKLADAVVAQAVA